MSVVLESTDVDIEMCRAVPCGTIGQLRLFPVLPSSCLFIVVLTAMGIAIVLCSFLISSVEIFLVLDMIVCLSSSAWFPG